MLTASVLCGTPGTAATFAPAVGPLAIGAVAWAWADCSRRSSPPVSAERALGCVRTRARCWWGSVGGDYPRAFYSSMYLAGVAADTVVSIGSAPACLGERRRTRRWMTGAALGLSGTVLLCAAEAAGSHPGLGPGARSAGETYSAWDSA
ncbi:hypothetical protein ABZ250_27875 [Streptomyces afghaniensis]|uniref:hypothetical protein n=1 Tax=Streptomyces afghaniensis TaxID=66865 RepID=UPI0033B44584